MSNKLCPLMVGANLFDFEAASEVRLLSIFDGFRHWAPQLRGDRVRIRLDLNLVLCVLILWYVRGEKRTGSWFFKTALHRICS
jgi:hypothetical protein